VKEKKRSGTLFVLEERPEVLERVLRQDSWGLRRRRPARPPGGGRPQRDATATAGCRYAMPAGPTRQPAHYHKPAQVRRLAMQFGEELISGQLTLASHINICFLTSCQLGVSTKPATSA